jgi:hypothetical protein
LWENLREGDNFGHSDVNGRVLLKRIFKQGDGNMGCFDLAQDRNRWGAIVNVVMTLRVQQNAGNFLSSLGRVSFSGRTLLHGINSFCGPGILLYLQWVFSVFIGGALTLTYTPTLVYSPG